MVNTSEYVYHITHDQLRAHLLEATLMIRVLCLMRASMSIILHQNDQLRSHLLQGPQKMCLLVNMSDRKSSPFWYVHHINRDNVDQLRAHLLQGPHHLAPQQLAALPALAPLSWSECRHHFKSLAIILKVLQSASEETTCFVATNPLPLPFNSATTTGWQFDLCRLQSEAWWAWFKSYNTEDIGDNSNKGIYNCEQENVPASQVKEDIGDWWSKQGYLWHLWMLINQILGTWVQ